MNNKKALFIVSSPFQALCSLEAISHYSIDDVHYLLFEDPIVREMTLPIIKDKGLIHFVEIKDNITVSIIKALLMGGWPERFDILFVGDYFSYGQYEAAVIKSKLGANLFYLDDGNSTLLIAPPISLKRGRSKREKKYYVLWDIIAKLKNIKKHLFTIYDLNKGCPLPVEKNFFLSLAPTSTTKKGIFVIGTNSSVLSFKSGSYSQKLTRLAQFLNSIYPNECVYYCPHRRDTNDYSDIIKSLGWELFDTKYNVEIDFVRENMYPCCVVGFGSTALLTLKKIFQSSDVKTIYMDLELETSNKEYRSIESYYINNGIEVVHI